MMTIEHDLGPLASWRNSLLLALLVWLLTWLLYTQTFQTGIRAGDLQSVFDASRHLQVGRSVYAAPTGEVRFVYSPLVAFAMRPLAHLPVEEAVHIWFFFCVLSLLMSVFLFAKAAAIPLHDAAPLGIMLIIAFHYRPTTLDFNHGQFNMPVLALLCAAYLADNRNRPFSMATFIVFAALIKVWALGLLIYLLVRRKPLAFLWGFALFAGIVALLYAKTTWEHATEFPQAVLRFFSLDLAYGFGNQSILGFARVHFGPNPDAQPLLDDPVALYTVVGAGFLTLMWGFWLACRKAPTARPDRVRLIFSLAVVTLLLALPVCERPYFVLLLPVFWTLLTSDGIPNALRGATVLAYAIFTLPFSKPAGMPDGLASLIPSAFFAAAFLLWIVLIAAIRRRPTRV